MLFHSATWASLFQIYCPPPPLFFKTKNNPDFLWSSLCPSLYPHFQPRCLPSLWIILYSPLITEYVPQVYAWFFQTTSYWLWVKQMAKSCTIYGCLLGFIKEWRKNWKKQEDCLLFFFLFQNTKIKRLLWLFWPQSNQFNKTGSCNFTNYVWNQGFDSSCIRKSCVCSCFLRWRLCFQIQYQKMQHLWMQQKCQKPIYIYIGKCFCRVWEKACTQKVGLSLFFVVFVHN